MGPVIFGASGAVPPRRPRAAKPPWMQRILVACSRCFLTRREAAIILTLAFGHGRLPRKRALWLNL